MLRTLLHVPRRHIITGPRFTPIVQSLPSIVPFVAPEEIERSRGRAYEVRLGANELTMGPSPSAVDAMRAAAAEAWKYGDPKSHDLRHELERQAKGRPEDEGNMSKLRRDHPGGT